MRRRAALPGGDPRQNPERIDRAVLVSPAGGPNNRPVARALRQMILDAPREPVSMLPIAVRDYLRFGVLPSLALFRAMTQYPTLERVASLVMPTLVIAGDRDPLVRIDRVGVFAGLPHVDAVKVRGAHALDYSHPALIAGLIEAHVQERPLVGPPDGRTPSSGSRFRHARPRSRQPPRGDVRPDRRSASSEWRDQALGEAREGVVTGRRQPGDPRAEDRPRAQH